MKLCWSTVIIWKKYNIVVHHQITRSPKTNMLEIGAWKNVQSKIENVHHHNVKQHNALSQSIKKAWCNVEEQERTKIWEHFLKVLGLIILDQGGNDLLEIHRGLTCIPRDFF